MTTKVKAFLLAALLVGCAEGTENDDDGLARDGDPVVGDGEVDGADGDAEDGTAFDGEDGASEDGADGTGDGADGSDGDLGELDAGLPGDGTPGDGTPSDGTPSDGTPSDGTPGDGSPGDGDGDPEPMCPATSGCNAAAALSDFNGDESGQGPVSTTGSGSKWLKMYVHENSSGISDLSVRYELTGLADANYDLFVYQSCGDTNPQKSQNLGAAQERVELSWSDTWLGVDDSRTLFIEVRHISGACSNWELKAVKP